MYNFASDYLEGAHPQVLEALCQTNDVQTPGYGQDDYCLSTKELLKKQLKRDDVDIHFLVGGTQTNMIVISSALKPYQAVITVDSGHINTHETGAVEFTGHKILTRPHINGKLTVSMIESILKEHPDEHMVQPKMVYISQTTEYGTYYTLHELKEIYEYCQKHQLYLFVDGARLGSALVLPDAPQLEDLVKYSDVFYIGGTKMGAMFGECLVIVHDDLKQDFRYHIKQKGAMLAKGRLLGVQFGALFTDGLYHEIGQHENQCADILRKGFMDCGYPMYIDSQSNQLFPIVDKKTYDYICQKYITTFMFDVDENHCCIRLVTSWATTQQACHSFVEYLQQMNEI